MSKKMKNAPEVIEDKELDQASGGIALLLPAVQKIEQHRLSARKLGGDGTP